LADAIKQRQAYKLNEYAHNTDPGRPVWMSETRTQTELIDVGR